MTILGRVQTSFLSNPSLAEINWNATCKPKSYLPTSALNCANAPMVTDIKDLWSTIFKFNGMPLS